MNEISELYKAINDRDKQIRELKQEITTLKEKLKMYIPRKKVRTIYKELGKILDADIDPYILEQKLKQKEDV